MNLDKKEICRAYMSSSNKNRQMLFFYLAVIVLTLVIIVGTSDYDLLLDSSRLILPFTYIEIKLKYFYYFMPIFLLVLHYNLLFNLPLHLDKLAKYVLEVRKSDSKNPNRLVSAFIVDSVYVGNHFFSKTLVHFIYLWLTPTVLFLLLMRYSDRQELEITIWHFACVCFSLVLNYCIFLKERTKEAKLTQLQIVIKIIIITVSPLIFIMIWSNNGAPYWVLALLLMTCIDIFYKSTIGDNQSENNFKGFNKCDTEIAFHCAAFICAISLAYLALVFMVNYDPETIYNKIYKNSHKARDTNRLFEITFPRLHIDEDYNIRHLSLLNISHFSKLEGESYHHGNSINLHDRNLKFAYLENAHLQMADFRGAKIFYSDFGGANLSGADFRKANISHSDFDHSVFIGANLQKAVINYSHFSAANFIGANFDKINISNSDLDHTVLIGTDITRTSNIESNNRITSSTIYAEKKEKGAKGFAKEKHCKYGVCEDLITSLSRDIKNYLSPKFTSDNKPFPEFNESRQTSKKSRSIIITNNSEDLKILESYAVELNTAGNRALQIIIEDNVSIASSLQLQNSLIKVYFNDKNGTTKEYNTSQYVNQIKIGSNLETETINDVSIKFRLSPHLVDNSSSFYKLEITIKNQSKQDKNITIDIMSNFINSGYADFVHKHILDSSLQVIHKMPKKKNFKKDPYLNQILQILDNDDNITIQNATDKYFANKAKKEAFIDINKTTIMTFEQYFFKEERDKFLKSWGK